MKTPKTLIKFTTLASLALFATGAVKTHALSAQPIFKQGKQSQRITLISDEEHKHEEHEARHDDHEKHGGAPDKHDDDHDDHDKTTKKHARKEHEDSQKISLTSAQMREFAIATKKAQGGLLEINIERPAEIKFNQDRIVHVIPRVSGTVKSVFASEGQFIKKGSLMAVLDSRELADAKAEYLAASARFVLAKENLVREQRLSRRKILAAKTIYRHPNQTYRGSDCPACCDAKIAHPWPEQS